MPGLLSLGDCHVCDMRKERALRILNDKLHELSKQGRPRKRLMYYVEEDVTDLLVGESVRYGDMPRKMKPTQDCDPAD